MNSRAMRPSGRWGKGTAPENTASYRALWRLESISNSLSDAKILKAIRQCIEEVRKAVNTTINRDDFRWADQYSHELSIVEIGLWRVTIAGWETDDIHRELLPTKDGVSKGWYPIRKEALDNYAEDLLMKNVKSGRIWQRGVGELLEAAFEQVSIVEMYT